MIPRTALIGSVLFALAVILHPAWSPADDDSVDGSWPMYVESGDRTPPVKGTELVRDINAIRRAWTFERHMGVGKGLYPGPLRKTRKMGFEPFQGGASSPIVADGLVFVSYYKPDGGHPAKPEGWRTVGKPEEFLPPWFFSVSADDVLVAVDAATGKLRWERVEKGKGLNRLSHKRSHWGVSPAYSDGTVYHLGSMGILYATRARDGKELWETPTDPGLEKVRAEHIKARKLCWDSADRSSLIVAEDVVVVSRGGLIAYDVSTGKERWRTDGSVQSTYATPAIWRHKGTEYIVANTGGGTVRLIDAKTGKTLWTLSDLGPTLGTLSVHGDHVVLNAGTGKGGKEAGLHAMYELSLKGAKKLWSLPDTESYWHSWKKDSGPRQRVIIRDGLAYIVLNLTVRRHGVRMRLIVADVKSGRRYSDQPFDARRGNALPLLIEDRILMIHDDAHGDPISASYWSAGKTPRKLNSDMGFPHVAITAYCTPIITPYVDGRMWFRSIDGLVCYDFRKAKAKDSVSMTLTIPDKLTGPRGDIGVSLYGQGTRITRGGVDGADLMHAAGVSKLKWEGDRLTGLLGIDLPRTRKAVFYELDARKTSGGKLTGTVRLEEKALNKPIPLAGAVHSMKHQPAWQPKCDYVFWLEGAARNKDGQPGRLLLFVTVKDDGSIQNVSAWADRTTKTRPAVYPEDDFRIKNGKLVGSMVVRYRADQWTRPLTAEGYTAAAKVTMQAVPSKGDQKNVGTYKGTYGVAWSKQATLSGQLKH